MPDVLIKLYDLPDLSGEAGRLETQGVQIRRALASEGRVIGDWVEAIFGSGWASETAVALTAQPARCWVAVALGEALESADTPYEQPPETLVGFACYDAVRKGLFGPLGVHPGFRDRTIGSTLMVRCLEDMQAQGYAYAVATWVASVTFYEKTVGGTVISGSEPGLYRGPLVPE